MKSNSVGLAKSRRLRLVINAAAVLATTLGSAAWAGLSLADFNEPSAWAIMPSETYAQLLAGLGGMGLFVALRQKRD